jgi:hypothetical protein
MTLKQLGLLTLLHGRTGLYLRGSDVRIAQRLAALGLVVVEDNGFMKRLNAERWFVSLTEPGREVLVRQGIVK